jgi:hypothetical protein
MKEALLYAMKEALLYAMKEALLYAMKVTYSSKALRSVSRSFSVSLYSNKMK